jgi:hypothetical protein
VPNFPVYDDLMKRLIALICCWGIVSAAAKAGNAPDSAEVGGVSLDILFEHDQFLVGEPVTVGVRLINRSGRTLELGKDNSWLRFSVETNEKKPVRQYDNPSVSDVFSLPNMKMGTKVVTLTPSFDFSQPGRYFITASVLIPNWSGPITGRSKPLDVTAGILLGDVEFGVPAINGVPNAEPETRRYALRQADPRGQLTLYFTLTDKSGSRVYRAFPICGMVSFSKPDLQLDDHSNAHILNQIDAKNFIYYEINFEGVIVGRQTYEYTKTRPRLARNASGQIVVGGGFRVVTKTDLPPPELPEPDPTTPDPTPPDAPAPKH